MKKFIRCLLVLSVVLMTTSLRAEDQAVNSQRKMVLNSRVEVKLNYLLYLPKNYAQETRWPVLLFLHGSGERGDNIEKVKMHGPPKLIAQGQKFPFIVVSPQCPADKWWEPIELVALLDEVSRKYKVDEDRIVVTGLSMGGFGTWSLAHYAPERLAAIAPICGGGEAYWARRLARLPVWAFHGAKDPGVPLKRSQEMVDALKKQKADPSPKFTIYPNAKHDAWTETYNNPELYKWLLKQKRNTSLSK